VTLYASYLDTARVEKLGTAPLQPLLRSISDLKVNSQLPAVFAHVAQLGVNWSSRRVRRRRR